MEALCVPEPASVDGTVFVELLKDDSLNDEAAKSCCVWLTVCVVPFFKEPEEVDELNAAFDGRRCLKSSGQSSGTVKQS